MESDNTNKTLLDRLIELRFSDMLPLHMPGHKRKGIVEYMEDIYGIDITEIDGFDDLHDPSGIILEMERKAAELYGCDIALLSVNGSTAANEAAILTACEPEGEIILARSCHKSVYYAIELAGINPIYLWDCSFEQNIARELDRHPNCRCVVITSPTYEGRIIDIEAISQIVHAHGAVLIVDCAHGAHLGFGSKYNNPITQGADLVILSLHKTLPAPTQTALLLINEGRVDVLKARHYMRVFQSSSPSYILMAGIGECLKYMEHSLCNDMKILEGRIEAFKEACRNLETMDVNPYPGNDPLKIIIKSRTGNLSGYDIYTALLDEYHIQCEMYSDDYALAMLSPMDGEDTFRRLTEALVKLDSRSKLTEGEGLHVKIRDYPKPETALSLKTALSKRNENINLDEKLCGRIAAAYIMEYPPGIPIVVPGERIDEEIVKYIRRGMEMHLNICGLVDGRMPVICND